MNPIHIGVAVDGSTLSHKGFEVALRLRRKGDHVSVVHVFDTVKAGLPPKYQADNIKQAFTVECVGSLPAGDFDVVLSEKPDHSKPARHHLVSTANKLGVGLLVVGTHGRKGRKEEATILGDTTDFSIRNAAAAVVVTKERRQVPTADGPASFVVAVDASAGARLAFQTVASVVRPGDRVSCVHVLSPGADAGEESEPAAASDEPLPLERLRADYEGMLAALPGGAGAGGFSVIEGANLSDAIAGHCNEAGADFLAVGADGMRSFAEHRRYLGSVSDSCIRKAECHVIVAKSTRLSEASS